MPLTRTPFYFKVKDAFRFLWIVAPPFPDTGPLLPPISSIYGFLVDAAYNSLCGGSGKGTVEIERETSSCSECKKNNGRDVKWAGQRLRVENGSTGPNDPPIGGYEADEHEKLGEVSGNADEPNRFSIPDRLIGYRKAENVPKPGENIDSEDPTRPSSGCKWYRIKQKDVDKKDANGNTVTEKATFRTEWVMSSCKVKKEETVEVSRPDGKKKTKPLIIDPEWVKKSEYLVLTHKKVGDKLAFSGLVRAGNREKLVVGPVTTGAPTDTYGLPDLKRGEKVTLGSKGDKGEKETFSVAQVKVYNSTGADLFNQDWRVRLVPFNPDGINSDIGELVTKIPGVKSLAKSLIVH